MKRLSNKKKLDFYIFQNHLDTYMNADIFSISELLSFEKNEFLVQSGYPSDYIYFLVDGNVLIFEQSPNDKHTCISYCHSLTVIGEAASLWNMTPIKNVKAMSSCICVGINLNKYRKLLLNDLLFMQNICQILSCKLNSENELSQTLLEPLEMRLSKFIIKYSDNGIFDFQLINCADILNSSYRHLLRILKLFCSMDILKKSKKGYVIVDRERLELISKGSLLIENQS